LLSRFQVHGWMNRMLMLNVEYNEDNEPRVFNGSCTQSRDLTIQNLLRRGDDRAARCLLEVGQIMQHMHM
jgi:hypothetical protein